MISFSKALKKKKETNSRQHILGSTYKNGTGHDERGKVMRSDITVNGFMDAAQDLSKTVSLSCACLIYFFLPNLLLFLTSFFQTQ